MIVIRGNAEQPVAQTQHLVVALRVIAIQPIVLTSVIIDLHSPETAEILVIVVILKGPVRMIVAGEKSIRLHLINIFIDIVVIPIAALRKGDLFFLF